MSIPDGAAGPKANTCAMFEIEARLAPRSATRLRGVADSLLQDRSALRRSHRECENRQRQENDKQNLRDRRGDACETDESERGRRERENEEHKRPPEHATPA